MKPDKIFIFHRSLTSAWVSFFSGAKERVGYKTKNGRAFFLTDAVREPDEIVHDVHYFVHLVQAAGLKTASDYHYDFFYTDEDLKKAEKILADAGANGRSLVAINPGANWRPKRWPPESFAELARQLVQRYRVQIVITGSANDSKVAGTILKKVPEAVSVCGKTNLRNLGALFSKCRLMISNDTGPLHIASAVGTPVIGLFGPTSSRETAPLGKGKNVIIHYVKDGYELPWIGKPQDFPAPWMELITVDDVLDVIEKEKLVYDPQT